MAQPTGCTVTDPADERSPRLGAMISHAGESLAQAREHLHGIDDLAVAVSASVRRAVGAAQAVPSSGGGSRAHLRGVPASVSHTCGDSGDRYGHDTRRRRRVTPALMSPGATACHWLPSTSGLCQRLPEAH
jgi:hypothetical protein